SVELAKEKGPFPLFDAEKYLAAPRFASRLPEELKAQIRQHGIRNSHLLAIAPTGTISLAFADNASNGIEPAFSWFYTRKKRMADDTRREYHVEDHAYRVFRHFNGIGDDVTALPFDAFGSTRGHDRHSRACAGRVALSCLTAIRAGLTRCAIRWVTSRCSSGTSRTDRRIRSRCGSTAANSRVASARSPRLYRWI